MIFCKKSIDFLIINTYDHYVAVDRRMKKTRTRRPTVNYKRCEECDITVSKSNWSRHRRAHEVYGGNRVPRGRPRTRCVRSQQLDIHNVSLEKQAIIRMVARRLYTLENLGVPVYAQLAIIHEEFPTLTAHTRQICQTMAKTILSAVKNEIRTALPYMRCHSLGIGIGRASTEIMPATESSSMSLIPPSGQDTGINIEREEENRFENEAQSPVIQLYETDVNDNEVVKRALQLEATTSTPAVEKKDEERIATTKYKRKKRTTHERSTKYDSIELLPIPRLTRQQSEESHIPVAPATQAVRIKSVAVRHDDAKKKTGEHTSVSETLESASKHQYATSTEVHETQRIHTGKMSPVVQGPTANVTVTDRRHQETHRVLASPRRSTPLTYGGRDHHTRQDKRESRDRSPSAGRDRKAAGRSRERSRPRESIRFRHGHSRDDRDWRPPITNRQQEQGRFELERFRREMLDELRRMIQHSKK